MPLCRQDQGDNWLLITVWKVISEGENMPLCRQDQGDNWLLITVQIVISDAICGGFIC